MLRKFMYASFIISLITFISSLFMMPFVIKSELPQIIQSIDQITDAFTEQGSIDINVLFQDTLVIESDDEYVDVHVYYDDYADKITVRYSSFGDNTFEFETKTKGKKLYLDIDMESKVGSNLVHHMTSGNYRIDITVPSKMQVHTNSNVWCYN